MTVIGTLEALQEVIELGPLLWRLAALRSRLFETERYLLAETLRDVADALEREDAEARRLAALDDRISG